MKLYIFLTALTLSSLSAAYKQIPLQTSLNTAREKIENLSNEISSIGKTDDLRHNARITKAKFQELSQKITTLKKEKAAAQREFLSIAKEIEDQGKVVTKEFEKTAALRKMCGAENSCNVGDKCCVGAVGDTTYTYCAKKCSTHAQELQ